MRTVSLLRVLRQKIRLRSLREPRMQALLALSASLLAALLLVPAVWAASSPAALSQVAAPANVPQPVSSGLPTQVYLATALAVGGALCLAFGARLQLGRVQTNTRLQTHVSSHLGIVIRSSDEPSFRARALDPLIDWLAELADRLLPDRQMDQI